MLILVNPVADESAGIPFARISFLADIGMAGLSIEEGLGLKTGVERSATDENAFAVSALYLRIYLLFKGSKGVGSHIHVELKPHPE